MTRLSLILALFMPTAALSHSGDHSQSLPTHMLSQPDHLAVLALIAAVGLGVWVWRRNRP